MLSRCVAVLGFLATADAFWYFVSSLCHYTEYGTDGECDSVANTDVCDWDGGDCCASSCIGDCAEGTFNCQDPDATDYVAPAFPDCSEYYWSYLGNGDCDYNTNTPDCGWDGGDCCNSTCVGSCSSGSIYCADPTSPDYNPYPDCTVSNINWIGDDYCDGSIYNVAICGWDGGDCCNSTCAGSCSSVYCADPTSPDYNPYGFYPDCTVSNINWIGDNVCDGSIYNVASCGWDGGDCCYSTCVGSCSSGSIYCADPTSPDYNPYGFYPDCTVSNINWIGNDNCDGSIYNVASCGWDGGDCCNSTCAGSCSSIYCADPTSPDYDALAAYPFCDASIPYYVADGYCDGGSYNVASCGWDGGDCCNSTCRTSTYSCSASFDCRDPNADDAFPTCDVVDKSKVGDGYCDGNSYNNPGCNWDGGDCCETTCIDGFFSCAQNTDSLDCRDPYGTIFFFCPADSSSIADGVCDSSGPDSPNTFACNWDGGDCCQPGDTTNCLNPYSPYYAYSSCTGAVNSYIGDGYCDGGNYNTPGCGWDGGDCCSVSCTDTLIYTCGDNGYDCQSGVGSSYTTITFLYTSSTSPSIAALSQAIIDILGLAATDLVDISVRALTANSVARRLQDTTVYRVTIVVVTGNNNFFAAASLIEQDLPNRMGEESATVSSGQVLDAQGNVDPDGNEPPVPVGTIVGVVVAIILVAVIVVVVVVVVGKRGKGIDTGDAKAGARSDQYKTNEPATTAQGTASI